MHEEYWRTQIERVGKKDKSKFRMFGNVLEYEDVSLRELQRMGLIADTYVP